MGWVVIDSGCQPAVENMRKDTELLESLMPGQAPILHFYDWEGDSATYGYFISPDHYFSSEGMAKRRLNLARRPTGGGIIFHLWDMAFSALVPSTDPAFSLNTIDNYAYINNAVLKAVQQWAKRAPHLQGSIDGPSLEMTPRDFPIRGERSKNFCMARPTQYDVLWQGKKIAGAAQRRTKGGFLHQGTISLCLPSPDYLKDVLRREEQEGIIEAIHRHTHPLLAISHSSAERQSIQADLKKELHAALNHFALEKKFLNKEQHGQKRTEKFSYSCSTS